MDRILSPLQLWQDFDAKVQPLDVNVISHEEKDGIVTQRLYFTGAVLKNGSKVRVFGTVKYKNTASNKVALLLINSAYMPINEDELLYWANNGMVAMSIDYNGECDKSHYTVYPMCIPYCNYTLNPTDDYAVSGLTAKESKWYYYIANSRRAITYLESLPFVKGVSIMCLAGGTRIGLPTMIDKRIKSCAIVFGQLEFELASSINTEGEENSLVNQTEELTEQLQEFEMSQIWQVGLCPLNYIALVEKPIYFVCGGNSLFTGVRGIADSFSRANKNSKLLVVPNTLDYLTNDYMQGIVRWLKGNNNVNDDMMLSASVQQGELLFELDTTLDIDDISLWYCRQPSVQGNNWVNAQLKSTDKEGVYTALGEVFEDNTEILAVAVCQADISVSTSVLSFVAKDCRLMTPTNILYGSGVDTSFIPINRSHSWHGQELQINKCKGYLGIQGIKGKIMGSFAIRDSAVRHLESDTISFDVCCDIRQTLVVAMVNNFATDNEVFVARVQLLGDGKWQRVILSAENFYRRTDGHSMPKDTTADLVIFYAEEAVIINNVLLV